MRHNPHGGLSGAVPYVFHYFDFSPLPSGANMKNAVVTEAYVSGATKMEPTNIEGAGENLSLSNNFVRHSGNPYMAFVYCSSE